MTRIPEMVVFSSIQPIMFVLLFAYVFGGAIPVPGAGGTTAYREFLLPGIFVQTLAFTAATTSVGLADDLHKGLIDRFRSLPISRSAVLAGRTTADWLQNLFVLLVMAVCGTDRRLAHPRRIPQSPGRIRAADALRLRDELDRRHRSGSRSAPSRPPTPSASSGSSR